MNAGDIAERLIQAAEIDRYSGSHVGPQQPRSLALPYTFDFADKAGWGAERLAEDRKAFWESLSRRPTARQVSEAEEAWSWLALVTDERQRAALAAWVHCMAYPSRHFKDWCFGEGFHPETGRRRKDRAIACILRNLVRKPLQNIENAGFHLLLDDPEIGDIESIIEIDAPTSHRTYSWADDQAFQPFIEGAKHEFSWAERRNEIRRQREARKRKEAA